MSNNNLKNTSRTLESACERGCDLHCLLSIDIQEKLDEALKQALLTIRHILYEPEQPIFFRGESRDSIVCILSGLVKLADYSSDGEQRIVLLASKGCCIGLSSLFNQTMRHDAIALRRTEVCIIPVGLLKHLMQADIGCMEQLMWLWQHRLDLANLNISKFSTGSVHRRVVQLILYLAELDKPRNFPQVTLINREDMAAILGVTTESVCRTISKLISRKALRKISNQTYLINYQTLMPMLLS